MPFITKLDFSDNRQVKQRIETIQVLSGATSFGVPFSSLPTGPNINTSGVSETHYTTLSTFSGNSGSTSYTWYDSRMMLGESMLLPLTFLNSGMTQNTGPVFSSSSATIIDGNLVNLSYTGVSFDITVIDIINLGLGNYSGSVQTNRFDVLSATSLDFTGRTIWADVSGITRTQKLIITDNPIVGYVWTCNAPEGSGFWAPSSGTSGTTSIPWTAGTGSSSASLSGSNSIATGNYSVAEGHLTVASGTSSHAEGFKGTAGGTYSHTEGGSNISNGYASHAEGGISLSESTPVSRPTLSMSYSSHAEGAGTTASGVTAHAEGEGTKALADYSHAEGLSSTANGLVAHAEGESTTAAGEASHSEGQSTTASGSSSHAEGNNTTAIGLNSHAEGNNSTAIGTSSHAQNNLTIALNNYTHASGNGSIASGQTSFVHGVNSIAGGDSTIVLGNNITGATPNYTYVESLNIKTVGSGGFVNDIRIDGNGNLTTNTSDVRLKENITTLTDALAKIKKLRGVSYNWIDRQAGGDNLRLGFIAQEVEQVDQLLVFTNKNDDYKGLHIDGIIPLIVEAIKELSSGVTTSNNTHLETETILAEDNNIELNYSGNTSSAIGGGIRVLHAIGQDNPAQIITDENGDWITNNDFKSKALTIPTFTPLSSQDINGSVGNITRDEDYLYIKTANGWKRSNLESF